MIDLNQLVAAIKPETALVSIMGVNNEIGVVQPLKEIGQVKYYYFSFSFSFSFSYFFVIYLFLIKICRSNKIFFHSDLAQMAGKLPIDVDSMNIDLASISSHKVFFFSYDISLNIVLL